MWGWDPKEAVDNYGCQGSHVGWPFRSTLGRADCSVADRRGGIPGVYQTCGLQQEEDQCWVLGIWSVECPDQQHPVLPVKGSELY